MTEDEIAAIEARADAAEPGPWPLPEERVAPSRGGSKNYDERLPLDHEGCDEWPWNTEANMIFAYRARDDVPALVAEVRRLLRWMIRTHAALAEHGETALESWTMHRLEAAMQGQDANDDLRRVTDEGE